MIQRVIAYVYKRTLFRVYRSYVNDKHKKKLTNENFSIISNNCIGGITCSDLDQPFNSPTVDCFFYSSCYIKFCQNLKYYFSQELVEVPESKYAGKCNYVVAHLDDIEIHFIHDQDFSLAKEKWDRRKQRVNFDNLFFTMSDRDLCDESDVDAFLNIDKDRAIFFSAQNRSNANNFIYCYDEKGEITTPLFAMYRTFEKYFNMVEWLNTGSVKAGEK
ncbi:DUF1919 domain-containing protein [Photobacterium sp. NCIMB 13483]|uniref:DUF1919 domain-containing protein n=1 Tax=Photobacterium piscicola TaxID=1378299 RepID=A0A1T5HV96_9GAMM|nr:MULTISPECIES: DUF1919 domain-containing protein [Photobacterium]PST93281.1 DUF1919 domain-containing protein [Photobacterium sp. NCIMB 13483]SKC30622.1 hypothetical protein CZ809_00098 [Photobacterium piscicola]